MFSVVIYTVTALLLFVLAINVSNRDKVLYASSGRHLTMGSWEIVTSFVIFCFIAGARYKVGVDHLSYLAEYQNYVRFGSGIRDTMEPGFVFITKFFSGLGLHFFFYFAFWAFLQIFFVYKSCEDEKYLLPYIALCIMLGPYFLSWMNGIRQCVVACFFVYSVRFIDRKQLLPFVLGILLASTIHRSALMLLPFFLLAYRPVALKNRAFDYGLLVACVLLGASPSWLGLTGQAADVLEMLGYDEYADRYDDMVEMEFTRIAWGPSRISIFLTDVLIILFYPKMREYYEPSRKLDILFFLFFFGVCLYNLFANTSHIFLRPIEYFTLFRLPLTAYTLFYLKKAHKTKIFIAMCLLLFTYIYFIVYKSTFGQNTALQTNLYKFFFMQ